MVGQAAGLTDLPAAIDLYRPEVGLVDLGINFELHPGVFDLDVPPQKLRGDDIDLPLVYLVPVGAAGSIPAMGRRSDEPSSPLRVSRSGSGRRSDAGATRAGRAILARDAAPEVIVHAFHAVVDGLLVQDPKIEGGILSPVLPVEGEGRTESAPTNPLGGTESAVSAALDSRIYEQLTARELEVLGLIADGLPNKRVAQRLGISEHTVKYHINTILGKLGAESRTEAVTRAARLGWLIL